MNGRLSTSTALFPTLGDKIYDGKEQEWFVRCAVAGDLRVPVPAPDGPKIFEHLEGLLKHGRLPSSGLPKQLEAL